MHLPLKVLEYLRHNVLLLEHFFGFQEDIQRLFALYNYLAIDNMLVYNILAVLFLLLNLQELSFELLYLFYLHFYITGLLVQPLQL